MTKFIFPLVLLGIIIFQYACGPETDLEKPEIDLDFVGAFPVNCDTLYFGDTLMLKMRFSDNVELGSFSINIHHNFDGHSHSTELTECDLDSVKTPVNPYSFIQDFTIPDSLSNYETDIQLFMPKANIDGDYDEGDYHFFISVTDHEGWSTQKGLSIKMLRNK